MGKIFIIRHGQDKDNAKDILNGRRNESLTELGKNQAQKTADKLSSYAIDIIYSSPLKRAMETAQIIATALGIHTVTITNDLVERDFGVLTGTPKADIPKYSQNILEVNGISYFLDAHGAESFPDLYKRAGAVLKDIQNKHPLQNVLIITHEDAGKMIRAFYYGWTWEEGLKRPNIDNAQVVALTPLNE